MFVDGDTPIGRRALTYLLHFDGLVLSDPADTIASSWNAGRGPEAVAELQRLCKQIAEIGPLLDPGIIRISSAHPRLEDEDRASVLDLFGVDASMRVFTNFAEAFSALEDLGRAGRDSYIAQSRELLRRFEVTEITVDDAAEARES